MRTRGLFAVLALAVLGLGACDVEHTAWSLCSDIREYNEKCPPGYPDWNAQAAHEDCLKYLGKMMNNDPCWDDYASAVSCGLALDCAALSEEDAWWDHPDCDDEAEDVRACFQLYPYY